MRQKIHPSPAFTPRRTGQRRAASRGTKPVAKCAFAIMENADASLPDELRFVSRIRPVNFYREVRGKLVFRFASLRATS